MRLECEKRCGVLVLNTLEGVFLSILNNLNQNQRRSSLEKAVPVNFSILTRTYPRRQQSVVGLQERVERTTALST